MTMIPPPLRIAVLSIHTCPLARPGGIKTGGMNVYVRELSQELARRGHRVDVFTRNQDSCADHNSLIDLAPGLRLFHISSGSGAYLPGANIYPHLPTLTENILSLNEREEGRYDLIHSHYWLSGWVGQKLKAAWDVPLINMFHTLGLMKNRIALTTDEHEPETRITTEHDIIKASDCLIAATPGERIQLMWLYGADMRKIRVVAPGVNTDTFQPVDMKQARAAINVPEDSRMLLFVGRIEPLKGIETLLRAVALLRQHPVDHLSNLCVAIVGGEANTDGIEDAEMRRLVALREELGLQDFVTFLGAREQDTLQYYYAASEAVIMPSYYESFGMVALEAMACGTPVIASEVGGLAYLIQDGVTGFHVPDRDPAELAGKIHLLLENSDLRKEMSLAAFKHARQYSWPHIADQISGIYQENLVIKKTP